MIVILIDSVQSLKYFTCKYYRGTISQKNVIELLKHYID